jgi:hypothetical protein
MSEVDWAAVGNAQSVIEYANQQYGSWMSATIIQIDPDQYPPSPITTFSPSMPKIWQWGNGNR